MPLVLLARKPRGCGNSCVTAPTQSPCMQRRRQPWSACGVPREEGFTGAKHILEGSQGMAAGMSKDADPGKLTDQLGQRWALLETSFKYHASCRHTHPAADALLQVISTYELNPEAIARVTAHVHQAAIDILRPVVNPHTVHQSKFRLVLY